MPSLSAATSFIAWLTIRVSIVNRSASIFVTRVPTETVSG
jgi:hypothetical protein